MASKPIEKKNTTPIKILSLVLISSAIVLEICNFITQDRIATSFAVIVSIERFALISHFIEGIIAAFYTENKIKSSIYVFFVGTVGLLEIIESSKVKE